MRCLINYYSTLLILTSIEYIFISQTYLTSLYKVRSIVRKATRFHMKPSSPSQPRRRRSNFPNFAINHLFESAITDRTDKGVLPRFMNLDLEWFQYSRYLRWCWGSGYEGREDLLKLMSRIAFSFFNFIRIEKTEFAVLLTALNVGFNNPEKKPLSILTV